MNVLSEEKELYDPEIARSSGMSHVSSQSSRILRPRSMFRRDSGVSHYALNSMSTSVNVFEKSTFSKKEYRRHHQELSHKDH